MPVCSLSHPFTRMRAHTHTTHTTHSAHALPPSLNQGMVLRAVVRCVTKQSVAKNKVPNVANICTSRFKVIPVEHQPHSLRSDYVSPAGEGKRERTARARHWNKKPRDSLSVPHALGDMDGNVKLSSLY